MSIRFIKHLVRMTMRRNSFYVTLGVGQLLYEYGTSEVSRIYDSLCRDPARFKDKRYLRQQRKVLIRELLVRFSGKIQTMTTAERGECFVSQPTTSRLINLVSDCLRRFMPWGTACVIPEPFSPGQAIPALRFSGADPDREHPVEINRIHAILDPICFSRFTRGLNLDPPHKRLAMPRFSFSAGGQGRGDRFHPPELEEEDYRRLQSNREELARRRKVFLARRLDIYVDGVKRTSFDPRQTSGVEFNVGPQADVLEVRCQDAEGELALATLLLGCHCIPPGESFSDWVVVEGGQKVTLGLSPVRDASGDIEGAQAQVRYAETQPPGAISRLAQRAWTGLVGMLGDGRETSEGFKPGYAWLTKAGLAAALLITISAIIWLQLQPLHLDPPPPPRVELPPVPNREPASPTVPSTHPVELPVPQQSTQLIARAVWSIDPETAVRATRIESTRGGATAVDLSQSRTTLPLSFPVYDNAGEIHSRYRLTIVSGERQIWQRTIQPPEPSLTERRCILSIELFPRQWPAGEAYDLRVEGQVSGNWRPLGHVLLQLMNR